MISNLGNLINSETGRILKRGYTEDGYPFYIMSHKGILYRERAHRLVAQYYVYNPDKIKKLTVNHKNYDRDNCDEFNLEWMTIGENIRHSHIDGRRLKTVSQDIIDNLSIDLPEINSDIHLICRLLQAGFTSKAVARSLDISHSKIEGIRFKKSWTFITSMYEFKPPRKNGNAYGEGHGSNKFSEKQIHHVCNLLSSTNLRKSEISSITGVSRNVIKNIKQRKNWIHISNQYGI